ncbi:Clavaminate synthase-like protein [Nemania sp. FL0031]|nr:Clavaminate synthase-like protein [Nemania sp. FL0031]
MASDTLFSEIPHFPDDVPTAVIKVVTLERLRSREGEAEKDLLQACKESGFFLLDLRGDDTGKALIEEIDKLFSVCRETLNLPADVKKEYEHDVPRSFLGFKPRGQARTEKNEPDRYESFNIGQDGLMGNETLQKLPPSIHSRLPLIKSYLGHCQDIVALVSSALALQLDLPRGTFTSLQSPTKLSGTNVRLLKAFASPEAEDLRTALPHHTDFGTITLLANVVGGLQILQPGKSPMEESAWVWARPRPGHLIVNIGEAMSQWTGGVLRSSMHRVRHAPGLQRFVDKYSVVYLVRPERNASMKRLLNIDETGGDEGDGNLTAWEWEVKKALAMARADVLQEKGLKAEY